jgi:hypothetical protein
MELRAAHVKKYFELRVGAPDELMEKILATDLEIVRRRAVTLGVLEGHLTEKPIQIMLPDHFLEDDILYRLDTQKKVSTLRYSQAALTTLFYDETRLYYHQCNLDVITGEISDDVFGEFAFVDVVSMETFLTDGPEEDPNFVRLDLEIQLTNGAEFILTLRRHPSSRDYVMDPLLSESESTILKTLKTLVRETV